MGKAINGLMNRNEESQDTKNVIKLECLDFSEKTGSRVRAIIKKSGKNPHTKVVTKIREVTYLRELKVKDENGTRYETLTSTGWEIVEEISLPVTSTYSYPGGNITPEVVESVTRDLRPKRDELR